MNTFSKITLLVLSSTLGFAAMADSGFGWGGDMGGMREMSDAATKITDAYLASPEVKEIISGVESQYGMTCGEKKTSLVFITSRVYLRTTCASKSESLSLALRSTYNKKDNEITFSATTYQVKLK